MTYRINIEPHDMSESTAPHPHYADFRQAVLWAERIRKRGFKVSIVDETGRAIDVALEWQQRANMRVELRP